MHAIAIIRYRKPLDQVLPHVDEHRAYLRDLHAKGILIASGPLEPRFGGVLMLKVSDENAAAELDAIRDNDPFTKYGDAQFEMLPWIPNIGKEAMERLIG
jgi:uncharacterized protein YciI